MAQHRKAPSIRSRIDRLRQSFDRGINVDVFVNPSKYLKRLPIEKIVADTKVYRQGVERYKKKIVTGETLPPIIVVKHPTKDAYAVLDGHHRYYAYVELGNKEIDCALAGDFSSIVFSMAQLGWFQPHSKITEHLRVPALQLNENIKQFLSDFLKNPQKIEEVMTNYIQRVKKSL